MEENKYIIEIKDLRVEFKTETGVVKALNGLDLQLERGKTLGLVGETGAGKTTAGLAMLRLIPDPPGKVTSGEIYFNGENLFDKTENEMEKIRGEQISMIFQDPMTALNRCSPSRIRLLRASLCMRISPNTMQWKKRGICLNWSVSRASAARSTHTSSLVA